MNDFGERWMAGRGFANAFVGRDANGLVSFKAWLGGIILLDKPTSITINRTTFASGMPSTTTLDAQTVRIENIDNVPFERELVNRIGRANGLRMLAIGYHNHPDATYPDTDMQFGDTFYLNTYGKDTQFKVMEIQQGFTDRMIAIIEAVD